MNIEINPASQVMTLVKADGNTQSWKVSTSKHGLGQKQGSFQTPTGLHYVRAKIGDGLTVGSVLKGRRATGQIISSVDEIDVSKDWITTRILWLCGLEKGHNRGGDVDSMARYIYIHGTPFVDQLGTPASIGCIRMADNDVIELFDQVDAGITVNIVGS